MTLVISEPFLREQTFDTVIT